MTAHTPGPWTIHPREVMEDGSVFPRHVRGSRLGSLVCHLEVSTIAELAVREPGSFWDTTPRKEANALLIAAAPDLLDALTNMVEECAYVVMEASALDQARVAIAKARGET